MKKTTDDKAEKKPVQRFHRRPLVPPPDSSVWPEEYRGQRWKGVYAFFFAGKCQLCAYSFAQPRSLRLREKWHGQSRLLLCTNHPSNPGELKEVLPTDTCRNFKNKSWRPPRPKRVASLPTPIDDQSDPTVRRIGLGNGLFALVDAVDYEKVSKHKWYARHAGRQIYAFCRIGGRLVFMHRMIMRPRKGYVVDHIDHNGLNKLCEIFVLS